MLLEELNKEQRIIAEHIDGPLLVLAGAGSGKTRAITYRIANLINLGVKPYKILALTFTNKAAREMKDRINALTNSQDQVWVYTFHSFCVRVLRKFIDKLGYKSSFTIYDDDDQISLIKSIIKEKELDDSIYTAKSMHSVIVDAKNRLLDPDDWFSQSEKDLWSDKAHDIYYTYDQRLKKSNALDFNDLLKLTIELFQNYPETLKYYQDQFSYVHVDEYQDTNYAQYIIVKLLSAKSKNICVVGDDDQSIYGWRGADINNILNFEKDFSNAKVVKLEENYRSTSIILKAANSVIANNENRKEKSLWTSNDGGDLITVYTAIDERGEAAWVCDRINILRNKYNNARSIAILYRTNAQSRVLEEMFIRAGIAYRIYGAKRFYDRKEVKDVLAYLRLFANPSDDISLRRIINLPKRSIGTSTVDELVKHSHKNNISIYDTLFNMPDTLSSRPQKCVKAFATLIDELQESCKTMNLSEFAEHMVDKVGLITQYDNDLSEDARMRVENIKELLGAIKEFEEENEPATLESYLENVSLVTDLDKSDNLEDDITLMTLHSAKGLEFDTVFIVGMEENIFPSYRSIQNPDQLEEERRLCYVGITRARKKLFLSNAENRTIYNQVSHNKPSRFLDEIPEELLETSLIERRENTFESIIKKREQNKAKIAQQKKTTSFGFNSDNIILPKDVKMQINTPYISKSAHVNNINTKEIIQDFKPGDRVDHLRYGEGNIVSIKGKGKEGRIVVEFAAYGKKTFSLAVVPLRKI